MNRRHPSARRPALRLARLLRQGGRRLGGGLSGLAAHAQLGPTRELELRDFLPRR